MAMCWLTYERIRITHRCFPIAEYTSNVPLNWSSFKLCVGKLVTITAETTIAARVIATLAPTFDAPVCRFEACVKNVSILELSNETSATGNGIVEHYNG
jgi:hypothetical protein